MWFCRVCAMLSRAVVSIVAAQQRESDPLVKSTILFRALLAGAALGLPAAAQTYGSDEVTVNPQATGGSQAFCSIRVASTAVVVHPLLQPGQPDRNAPLRICMPYPHRPAAHHVQKVCPQNQRPGQPQGSSATHSKQQIEPAQDMLSVRTGAGRKRRFDGAAYFKRFKRKTRKRATSAITTKEVAARAKAVHAAEADILCRRRQPSQRQPTSSTIPEWAFSPASR